jgi:hypothetical protein
MKGRQRMGWLYHSSGGEPSGLAFGRPFCIDAGNGRNARLVPLKDPIR